MTLTVNDIREKLKQVDEVSLLEILNITSDEIVDRFDDRIEEREDYLRNEFEEEEDDNF